jgi:hypothetical protein
MNINVFSRCIRSSGKNIRNIYEELKASGLDVGTYHGFRSACYRAGLRRQQKRRVPVLQKLADSVKNLKEVQGTQGKERMEGVTATFEECRPGVRKHNSALPPVILPGGIEAIIDPETGAKRFAI